MAWRSSGDSHVSLVNALAKNRLLSSESARKAFLKVDRGWFVPPQIAQSSYDDRPLPIGYSVTISAPHMHAIMAEIMAPYITAPHCKHVLDVGSGSGFLTCVLAAMASTDCLVVGVEHVPELVCSSARIAADHFPEWTTSSSPRLQFLQGDGLHLTAEMLPFPMFDAIHVGAAPAVVPECLIELLAPRGVLVIPVGPQLDAQDLVVITKDEHGNVSRRVNSKVQFVPLTSIDHQLRSTE
jgi:protein-L-isoaspartate(D-aspartate) O-methyltransferase